MQKKWIPTIFLQNIRKKIRVFREMTPRARKYGLRYYFDRRFRARKKNAENTKRRRALAGNSISNMRKKKFILIRKYGPICAHCANIFDPSELTVDHIIPISRGGKNYLHNLQLLCVPCHCRKDNPPKRKKIENKAIKYALERMGFFE